MIQEPYWGPLVPARSDTDPQGVEVFGTINHTQWETFTPPSDGGEYPRVATFVHRSVSQAMTVTTVPESMSYHSIGLTLTHDTLTLTLLNIYHHVIDHNPTLDFITGLRLDPSIPTIIGGDFNTHSPLWSPHTCHASPWAPILEAWFDRESLLSTVPEGAITRQHDGQRPSLIDHILVNLAFLAEPDFPPECLVSFDLSLGSDHAGLLLDLPWAAPKGDPEPVPGWRIDDGMVDEWKTRFRLAAQPMAMLTDRTALSHAATTLLDTISTVSDSLFQKRSSTKGHSLPWWNEACRNAVTYMRGARGHERRVQMTGLRMTIRSAKREWYEKLLEDPSVSVWDLAKWRKGRRQPWIPPINCGEGPTSDRAQMSTTFRSHFFDLPPAESNLPPLPGPPHPMRPFYPVTPDEITYALSTCSTKSAPGLSGIGYKLVCWANESSPDIFTELYTACLRLGHHPWHEAKVVVIPKPGKPDYSAPKAL
jgi:hypothetical protein